MKVQLCSYLLCGDAVKLISAGLPLLLCLIGAPFVWIMSECDALSIVPLSEGNALSTLQLSNSHEVMLSEVSLLVLR